MQSFTQNLRFLSPLFSRKVKIPEPIRFQLELRKGYSKIPIFFTSLNCAHSSDRPISINSSNGNTPFVSCLTNEIPVQTLTVPEKVHCLVCEFKYLSEPIDRVKRLLHYATLLPPFHDSDWVEENKVKGCSTMVWLEAAMDNNRLMRFRVDSDSEITKGF